MTELLTFSVTFAMVFALAAQSLNTNQNLQGAAFVTSICIGLLQLFVLKTIPLAQSWTVDLAYLMGGPFGAIVAMRVHPWMTRRHRHGRNRSPANIDCGDGQ